MILKYPENICMLCIPMVMHKNPSDKSIGSLSTSVGETITH
ncbi:hypothetical protein M2L65_001772 [Staphylococcus pseudintermedius]|nr:hypothetical protein [Staphylococcus pseudintermedius]